jgi:hypothetical protein
MVLEGKGMTTTGKAMLEMCRSMRKLNSEISALMKTADNILSKRDYHPNPQDGSAVIGESSKSLDLPEKWTPMKLYRRYQRKSNLDDVIILNVVLDSLSDSEVLDEPLILGGRFIYEKGQAKECWGEWDSWDMWEYRSQTAMKTKQMYTKNELQENLGDFERFRSAAGWGIDEVKAMRDIKFIAAPLAEMVDSKALDREVFQPIL